MSRWLEMIEPDEAARYESALHSGDWQKVASERDIPLIEAVIARLEAQGRPLGEWPTLLLKVKRWLHIPFRE